MNRCRVDEFPPPNDPIREQSTVAALEEQYIFSNVVLAKLYDRKTAVTAADLLNDRVTLSFEEHDLRIDHMLSDRGTEFFGSNDRHDDEPP